MEIWKRIDKLVKYHTGFGPSQVSIIIWRFHCLILFYLGLISKSIQH